MTDVAEHHGEQEGERDDCVQTRVDLLVGGDSVRIHDGLETFRELVRADEGGGRAVRAQLMQDGRDVGARLLLQYMSPRCIYNHDEKKNIL